MTTSGVSPGGANATAPAAGQSERSPVSKETFLQLLVAQIRNQNPLNPADGAQFLTQLAQFSELEQMLAIRSEVSGLRADLKGAISETGATTNV